MAGGASGGKEGNQGSGRGESHVPRSVTGRITDRYRHPPPADLSAVRLNPTHTAVTTSTWQTPGTKKPFDQERVSIRNAIRHILADCTRVRTARCRRRFGSTAVVSAGAGERRGRPRPDGDSGRGGRGQAPAVVPGADQRGAPLPRPGITSLARRRPLRRVEHHEVFFARGTPGRTPASDA
jgi:hypothetical protein